MISNYETIDKEKSQVLLKITVTPEYIKEEYDKLMKNTQKTAQIQGFRKGKVPISILETKYKKGFLAEAASNIIDQAYKEIIDKVDKKPISYATPKLEELILPELGKDYTFELSYDVFPEFKICNYKSIEIVKDEIKITNEDINQELDKYINDF